MTDEQADTKVLDEGEVWSFLRRVLSQGGDIQLDYQAGKYKRYEEYSARLDCAARERAEKFMVLLNTSLAARERAVWLEAAERLEDDCYGGPTVDHDFLGHDDLGNERFKHNTNQVRIAKEFRQQAEG